MGVPASAIRKLIGRAAKTALSEGMLAREAAQFPGPLKSAMLRQAALSPKTERGYNQLNRLRALLEGMSANTVKKLANQIDVDKIGRPLTREAMYKGDALLADQRALGSLLQKLGSTETGTDEMWRKLMSS